MEKKRFISLRVKLVIAVTLMCLGIGLLAVISIREIAETIVDREYADKAEQISQAVAVTLDPDEVSELIDAVMDVYYSTNDNVVISSEWGSDAWNEYMAKYDGIQELPVYHKIQEQLRVYQDIHKVDCFYIVLYKPEVLHGIYVIDGAYDDDNCPPGCVDSFEDGIWPDKKDTIIPASITNEDVYGWLVTAGYIIGHHNEDTAYLCVDISMDDIKAKERTYVILTALAMLGMTIIILAATLWYANRNMVKPVVKLSDTARNYCSENNDVVHHAFERLEITTHDEIGQLLTSMKQMEQDMNTNINNLIDTKVALKASEEKAERMTEVALKDALTGIRNKTAYDNEVKKLEADLADGFNEFGLAMVDLNFLKRTNDTYGHDKGNISIRRLCMLVCEVFEHSPVFRIGGDEFIVVLKNRDYRNVDRLVEDFNNRLIAVQGDLTLKPWEQISAAIGYAKFDKTCDKTVEDVFKKADKAMYDRKVSMKAIRED